jgi:hypothetical protein
VEAVLQDSQVGVLSHSFQVKRNQQMVIDKDDEAVLISLELAGCMVPFKHCGIIQAV